MLKPSKDAKIIIISNSKDNKLYSVRKDSSSALKKNVYKDKDKDNIKPSIASLTLNLEPNNKQEKELLSKELSALRLELTKIKKLYKKDKEDSKLM